MLTQFLVVSDAVSATCTVVAVAVVRILSVRYRVKTSPAYGFRNSEKNDGV